MASKEEYDDGFESEVDSIMSFPADTKRDVEKHAAEARRRIVRLKDKFRLAISNRWRERFKEIKVENDALEKALNESYIHTQRAIVVITEDQIARLPK